MNGLNILFGLTAILALIAIEFAARADGRKTVAKTRISNVAESDYAPPKRHEKLVWGALISLGGLVTCSIIYYVISPGEIDIVTIAGPAVLMFFGLRVFVSKLHHHAALGSTESRLKALLAGDAISNSCFIFYFSAPDLAAPTHVKIWQDELDGLKQPYFIILREQKHLAYFSEPRQPITVFIPKRDLLNFDAKRNIKAVFYANNGQKNRAMVAENHHLQHVQLLHGDSDKPPSFSPLSKQYDHLFVAGQMAIDRYERHHVSIPQERFKIIGRPQVAKISANRLDSTKKTIAYLPTWRGFFEDTQFSSLDRAAAIISGILERNHNVHLLFKPHPMSFKDPNWPDYEREITILLDRHWPNGNGGTFCDAGDEPFDIYNKADILVTDISSVMIDFLYSAKPILLIKPQGAGSDEMENYPSAKACYQVDSSLANLPEMVEYALANDSMQADRLSLRDYAFGDIGQPAAAMFRKAVNEILVQELEGKGGNG